MKCRTCGHPKKVHQWTKKHDGINVTELGRCGEPGCGCLMFISLAAKSRRKAKAPSKGQVPLTKAFEQLVDQGARELLQIRIEELQEILHRQNEELGAWMEKVIGS